MTTPDPRIAELEAALAAERAKVARLVDLVAEHENIVEYPNGWHKVFQYDVDYPTKRAAVFAAAGIKE